MPRAAAGASLALLGVLVLATTQPWVAGLADAAPGSVRTRWSATGGELVPWAAAAALAAAAACSVLLARGGQGVLGRVAGLLATTGSLAAGAGAVLVTVGRTALPAGVVAAEPTGWSWTAVAVGAAAAAITTVGLLGRGRRLGALEGAGRRGGGTTPDLLPAERRRRQDARSWAELDAGRDPTRGPGAGTMAAVAPAQDPQDPPRRGATDP